MSKVKLNLEAYQADFTYELQDPRGHVQKEVYEAFVSNVKSGSKSAFVKVPARVGKTVVIAKLSEAAFGGANYNNYADSDYKVLVVTEYERLVEQTRRAIVRHSKFSGGDVGVYYGVEKNMDDSKKVIVTTYPTYRTLVQQGLYSQENFPLVIFDECERATGQVTEQLTRNHVIGKSIAFGLTATPYYHDEKNAERIFGTKVYNMDILDAYAKGLLVGFKNYVVHFDKIDLTHSVNESDEGFDLLEVEKALRGGKVTHPVIEIYRAHSDYAKKMGRLAPKMVVYTGRSIKLANELALELSEAGFPAVSYHSNLNQDEKERRLAQHHSRQAPILTNPYSYTRGIDDADLEIVVNLAPTHSAVREEQRSTRPLTPNDNRPDKIAFIYDFSYRIDSDTRRQIFFSDVVGRSEEIPVDLMPEVDEVNARLEQFVLTDRDVRIMDETLLLTMGKFVPRMLSSSKAEKYSLDELKILFDSWNASIQGKNNPINKAGRLIDLLRNESLYMDVLDFSEDKKEIPSYWRLIRDPAFLEKGNGVLLNAWKWLFGEHFEGRIIQNQKNIYREEIAQIIQAYNKYAKEVIHENLSLIYDLKSYQYALKNHAEIFTFLDFETNFFPSNPEKQVWFTKLKKLYDVKDIWREISLEDEVTARYYSRPSVLELALPTAMPKDYYKPMTFSWDDYSKPIEIILGNENNKVYHIDPKDLILLVAEKILEYRELDMFEEFYFKSNHLNRVAEKYGVSNARAQQIISRAVRKLKKAIFAVIGKNAYSRLYRSGKNDGFAVDESVFLTYLEHLLIRNLRKKDPSLLGYISEKNEWKEMSYEEYMKNLLNPKIYQSNEVIKKNQSKSEIASAVYNVYRVIVHSHRYGGRYVERRITNKDKYADFASLHKHLPNVEKLNAYLKQLGLEWKDLFVYDSKVWLKTLGSFDNKEKKEMKNKTPKKFFSNLKTLDASLFVNDVEYAKAIVYNIAKIFFEKNADSSEPPVRSYKELKQYFSSKNGKSMLPNSNELTNYMTLAGVDFDSVVRFDSYFLEWGVFSDSIFETKEIKKALD